MSNKFIIIALVLFCISCTNRRDRQQNTDCPETAQVPSYEIKVSSNEVVVTCSDSTVANKVNIKYLNQIWSDDFKGRYMVNINDLLRNDNINRMKIAYTLSCEDSIQAIITVNDSIDTMLHYKHQKREYEDYCATVTSKHVAPFSKEGTKVPPKSDVKRWLYDTGNYLNEDKVDIMYNIYSDLCTYKSNVYTIQKDTHIPIMKSFAGIKYPIKTNIKSDYYYLFATDNVNEITEFIGNMVSNDFINAETNINRPLSCYRTRKKDGILSLFLVSINRDWTSKVLPVGIVCIDNTAPVVISKSAQDVYREYAKETVRRAMASTIAPHSNIRSRMLSDEVLKQISKEIGNQISNELRNQNVDFIESSEYDFAVKLNFSPIDRNCPHRGRLEVQTGNFRGNYANFIFNFSGDVSSVAIKYEDTVNKVNLEGKKSPYTYNCWLPLNIGDNYVTISAQDKFGNASESLHKIVLVQIKDETPNINIDIDNDVTIF